MPKAKKPAAVQVKIRVAKSLKDEIERAAKRSGKSFNAEVVARIAKSLDLEQAYGGPEIERVIFLMASAFTIAGEQRAKELKISRWIDDADCFGAAVRGMTATLTAAYPTPTEDHFWMLVEALKSQCAARLRTKKVQP